MELLLEKGAHELLNTVEYNGCPESPNPCNRFLPRVPPLHEAICLGKLDLVSYLLRAGADPDTKDSLGQTAQDCAEECLLAAQSLTEQPIDLQRTYAALSLPSESQRAEVVQLLANHRRASREDQTPRTLL